MKMEAFDAYQKIQNLRGMDELKTLVQEWHNVASNLRGLSFHEEIIVPNCLFSYRSGLGFTSILETISQFLRENALLDFSGDISHFEYILDRAEDIDEFPAFPRLLETIKNAAGFKGSYRGLICIDISDWIEYLEDQRFLRFMEFVSDISEKSLIIFTVPVLANEELLELEAVLASYLRIRLVKLDYPEPEDFLNYLDDKLQKYEIHLNQTELERLRGTLEEVRNYETFDGYNTINRLVLDIIFEINSSNRYEKGSSLPKNVLDYFSKNGAWVRQIRINKKIPKIGFSVSR